MGEEEWNGRPDPVLDLTDYVPALKAPFAVPAHLAPGALEVLRGEYEPTPPPITPAFALRPGSLILDIGANIGAFARWAATRFPGAPINSYEPNPRALPFLRQNVATLPGVSVHATGVRAVAGEAPLHEGALNLGEASFCLDAGGAKNDTGVTCAFVDAADLPDAELVKVDTEGCEVEILERYLASRERVPLMVMLEFHRALDRLVLEELLELRGLHLVRGTILAPNRGTLIFARLRSPVRAIEANEAERLAERHLPRAAPFIAG